MYIAYNIYQLVSNKIILYWWAKFLHSKYCFFLQVCIQVTKLTWTNRKLVVFKSLDISYSFISFFLAKTWDTDKYMEIFFQNLSKLIHMHSTNAIRIIEFYGNRVFEWEYMNWDEKGFEIISFKWLLFLTKSE